MIEITNAKDQARLRRHVLTAQGLLQAQPFGTGLNGARKAIRHLGYVQIDTISVVERAHHHVLHSRVPRFTPAMTNRMLVNGDIFEYWEHAAAFLPMEDFRFSLPYKHAIKSGQTHWFKTRNQKLMAELLSRIRLDGPLRSRDVETDATSRAGWWDWKPAKKALEQLYMQGDLMVSSREGFQKTYDLPERVLPSHVDTSMPDTTQLAAHILEQQLRCQRCVSLKALAYQRRNPPLRQALLEQLNAKLEQGELQAIRVHTGDTYYIPTGLLDQPAPRVSYRMRILSPFDNSLIQRERLKALFGYEYQLECYLPAAKRQYGYFCLPLLYRDKFVGRMDCKAHRKHGHLEIKSLYLDPVVKPDDAFSAAFAEAVNTFCAFQGCASASLVQAEPASHRPPWESALAQSIGSVSAL